MALEPVQDLVRVWLELDGYFVRNNVRFKTATRTRTGRSAAYSDLDVIAVKIDRQTGQVTDRIWGEIKAHLTFSLTPGYVRSFLDGYAVMLNLKKVKGSTSTKAKWRGRQRAAIREARSLLGDEFRRVLFFGGRKPMDGGVAAKELLDPAVEVVYIRDFAQEFVSKSHPREGSEPIVRVINMLKSYGLVQG